MDDENYLKTSSTTVSRNRENIFWVDYEGSTTGSLKTRQGFGVEMTSGSSSNKLSCG